MGEDSDLWRDVEMNPNHQSTTPSVVSVVPCLVTSREINASREKYKSHSFVIVINYIKNGKFNLFGSRHYFARN